MFVSRGVGWWGEEVEGAGREEDWPLIHPYPYGHSKLSPVKLKQETGKRGMIHYPYGHGKLCPVEE